MGRFERLKCGRDPTASSRFDTCPRCTISSTHNPIRCSRHEATAATLTLFQAFVFALLQAERSVKVPAQDVVIELGGLGEQVETMFSGCHGSLELFCRRELCADAICVRSDGSVTDLART